MRWESSVYRHRKESPQLRGGSRNTQYVQNKPLQRLYANGLRREKTLPAIHLHTPTTPIIDIRNIPKIEIDISAPLTPRCQFGRPLLRRPATRSPLPVTKEDPLFDEFAKSITLRQKKFRTPIEQNRYYEINYPLLLHANATDTKPDALPKPPTPDLADNEELQRKLNVRSRVDNLEELVNTLEEETTDIDFRTELRDGVFDPTSYEWNKPKYTETPPITPPVSPETNILTDDDSITLSPRSMSP